VPWLFLSRTFFAVGMAGVVRPVITRLYRWFLMHLQTLYFHECSGVASCCLLGERWIFLCLYRACVTTMPPCHVGDVVCYQLMLPDNVRQLRSFAFRVAIVSIALPAYLVRLAADPVDCMVSERLWCNNLSFARCFMARCPPTILHALPATKPRWYVFASKDVV